jgi:uncharacterized protein (DUF305 family)
MKRTTTLSVLALTAALALTACGGGENENTGPDAGATATSSSPAATSAATDSATPSATGTDSATGSAEEISTDHNDADVMFAQMMIPHHQQAVQMSEIMLAKQDQDPQIRQLAEQIKAAQGPEIDRMNAMLSIWDQEPMDMGEAGDMGEMNGMDHGFGADMSGMMSQEGLDRLEAAAGDEAARLFLDGMIDHHKGAVDMAQDEVDNGQNPQARQLAEDVITAQETEILQMEQMLRGL